MNRSTWLLTALLIAAAVYVAYTGADLLREIDAETRHEMGAAEW